MPLARRWSKERLAKALSVKGVKKRGVLPCQ